MPATTFLTTVLSNAPSALASRILPTCAKIWSGKPVAIVAASDELGVGVVEVADGAGAVGILVVVGVVGADGLGARLDAGGGVITPPKVKIFIFQAIRYVQKLPRTAGQKVSGKLV